MADNNESYISLITSEHATRKKYVEYVRTFLDMISGAVNVLSEFDILFVLDTATGDQLDILGELVGISRRLPIVDPDIPPELSDESYRKVIKARILQNHWDGTRKGLEDIFDTFYPGLPHEIVDNQDMSYQVIIIDPNITAEDRALIFNGYIIPKPSGVRVDYNVMDKSLFGWDSETAFVDGWDKGTWSST